MIKKYLKDKMTIKVTVSNKTIVRIMAVVLSFVIGLTFLYVTRQALVLIAVAFFLALALNPPVSNIAKRLPSGSRGLATAISYLAVLAVLAMLAYAVIPPLIRESRNLIDKLPVYIEDLKTDDNFIANTAQNLGIVDDLSSAQEEITEKLSEAGGPFLGFLQRLSSSAVAILTILVLTFFMLVEGPRWMGYLWELHPKEYRKRRQELAGKMYRVVTGYVNGQLLIASIAAFSTLIILTVLRLFDINIPFPIPLAALVGLFGLIPLIGATIGSVVVIIVALFESVAAAIIMLVFFIIYQQIENNAIQPIIQAKTVDMSPLMILIVAIIGVTLAGLLGAVLAIPVAASLKILLNDYIERHHLASKTKKA